VRHGLGRFGIGDDDRGDRRTGRVDDRRRVFRTAGHDGTDVAVRRWGQPTAAFV
jgi:hypothetical protein